MTKTSRKPKRRKKQKWDDLTLCYYYFSCVQAYFFFFVSRLLLKHVYVATEKGHWKTRLPMWSMEAALWDSVCHWSLTPEKTKPVSCQPAPEDDGWTLSSRARWAWQDRSKQLRWIHHHINLPNCPSQGCSERLVQNCWIASSMMELLPCCVADMTSQWTRCLGALLAWPFRLRPWWGWQRAKRPWAEFWQCVEVKAAFVPQVIWISSVLPSKSLPSMMTPTGVHQKEKVRKNKHVWRSGCQPFVPCDVVVCSVHLGWPIYQRVYIYLGQLCRGQQHRRAAFRARLRHSKRPADRQRLSLVCRRSLWSCSRSMLCNSRMHRWQTLVESGMEPSKIFHGCNHSEPLLCC